MTDLTLTTTATVPTNTSIVITVYEDTDGDGVAENSADQSIAGGTNSYTLSGFNGSSGNDIWFEVEYGNTSITNAASVESVEVSSGTTSPSNFAQGNIDDVRFYGRALSDSEVNEINNKNA